MIVTVLNGSGVPRLAYRISLKLTNAGYRKANVTVGNATSTTNAATTVAYASGQQAAATAVASTIGARAGVGGRARQRHAGLRLAERAGRRDGWQRPQAVTFLDLPDRSAKPRERGITHVLDRGLALADVDGLVEVAGASVDIVKLGWGTAVVSANLLPKLARYREHGLTVVLGGTLTEVALRQGRIDGLVAWLCELGIDHVEVSDGTFGLPAEDKRALIRRLAKQFTVMSEVGSKDSEMIMAPYRWVEMIEGELAAGAWKVIAEARESGNAGIYRPDGEVRMGLIDEIAHAVDPELLIFEAPRKQQQSFFLHRFGPNCNLGNIAPGDVLSLETLRLGLRSDTFDLGPAAAG